MGGKGREKEEGTSFGPLGKVIEDGFFPGGDLVPLTEGYQEDTWSQRFPRAILASRGRAICCPTLTWLFLASLEELLQNISKATFRPAMVAHANNPRTVLL